VSLPLADFTRVRLTALPPLSLYIHIPWCLRKCPYCDFNSHEKRAELPEDAYVDALLGDLESALPQVWGRRVHTIFVGGGTPSLFSPASIDRLITGVRTRLPLMPDAEITLEANPGTFEIERFRGFSAAGITRLSVGVQSFDDGKLAALGRVHGADEARAAIDAALELFDSVNVDLMYALPGQTLEQALADVREAIERGAPHISAYHLTLEPDTHFHRHPPQLPDADAAADMQDAIEATLATAGFVHYETSAFARSGHRARHNLNYWTFGDYLGIGAGAHAKISFADRIVRESRIRKPQGYINAAAAGNARMESRDIEPGELPFEFMLNALRLVEGFPVSLFAERTGLSIVAVERELRAAEEGGLITRDHQRIEPTERGQRFLNDLLEPFLPARGAQEEVSAISISRRDTSRSA
jgi:oxygen-independent coproporphyrinogen-3 oxidase